MGALALTYLEEPTVQSNFLDLAAQLRAFLPPFWHLDEIDSNFSRPVIVLAFRCRRFITHISPVECEVGVGFVPNMRVPGAFYLNSDLFELQMEELQQYTTAGGYGGFLPAVKQIANVAALPGIVGVRRRNRWAGRSVWD